VVVKRLLMTDTVEEKMMALQERKRSLAADALSVPGTAAADSAKLSFEDLQEFFR
jgi:SNF2 family DNA or RNA helicase